MLCVDLGPHEPECQPDEYPVLIAEPPNSPSEIREKITEVRLIRPGTKTNGKKDKLPVVIDKAYMRMAVRVQKKP